MKVELDKKFDKNVFDTITTTILCIFSWKKSIKIALGKISYVNFCKLAQNMKKVDNFRQSAPPFDTKLR